MDQSACINSTDFCTISDFIELLDCDYKCLALLERIRWPNGFVCPRCGANKGYRIPEYKLIQCAACRRQTSATSGTIFHRSRVAIRKWFAAILLLLTDKSGLPALRLHQTIGVSYKTALAMLKKLRSVMGLQNQLSAESPELTELQNLLKAETQQQIKGHFQFSKQSIPEDVRPKLQIPANVQGKEADRQKSLSILTPELKQVELAQKRSPHSRVSRATMAGAVGLARHFFLGAFHRASSVYLQLYFDEFSYKYKRNNTPETIFAFLKDCTQTRLTRIRDYIDSIVTPKRYTEVQDPGIRYLKEAVAVYSSQEGSPQENLFFIDCSSLLSLTKKRRAI